MKTSTRILLGCLTCIQLLYVPLNRLSTGGIAPFIPLDAYIPLWPVWAVPYLLIVACWPMAIAWAVFFAKDEELVALVASILIASLAGIMTFALFPTYVIRPEITAQGWAADLLRWIYANDGAYNALPSGHVYMTTVLAYYGRRWFPKVRGLFPALVVVILLSTLFTHQHYLLDLAAGLFVGLAACSLGPWAARLFFPQPKPKPARLIKAPSSKE